MGTELKLKKCLCCNGSGYIRKLDTHSLKPDYVECQKCDGYGFIYPKIQLVKM